MPFVPPICDLDAFNCPHCGAFAHQKWGRLSLVFIRNDSTYERVQVARCTYCEKDTIWVDKLLVSPEASSTPPPNADLDKEIQADYREAAAIAERSPRGAAALLRLCVQKLCMQLALPGKNLDKDIQSLVEQGLDSQIQRALDVVRVIGNNAVHPLEMDLTDDHSTAFVLFGLVNLIAD